MLLSGFSMQTGSTELAPKLLPPLEESELPRPSAGSATEVIIRFSNLRVPEDSKPLMRQELVHHRSIKPTPIMSDI